MFIAIRLVLVKLLIKIGKICAKLLGSSNFAYDFDTLTKNIVAEYLITKFEWFISFNTLNKYLNSNSVTFNLWYESRAAVRISKVLFFCTKSSDDMLSIQLDYMITLYILANLFK